MICIEYNTYQILDQKKNLSFQLHKKNLFKIKIISKKI